jgi:hypothetical protein
MTSLINEEFLAILSAKHMLGAAFTPRHQGAGERAHQIIMNNHLLLINEVCKAFPQEWAVLVPALEYLCETSPREPYGLSAFDLSQGYALLTKPHRQLAPFVQPYGIAETEISVSAIQEALWRVHEGYS